MISRGTGRSAVAAAAYMSCSRMYNDYDGVQHDYIRKQGLVWQQIFLPDMAPAEWADREVLWNGVEEAEKTKASRLAREFVAALPIELKKDQWIALLTEFIQTNFVAEGMCADVCIHDTDGHNPHAHIMLTVRPLTKDGKWQQKTEKEYLCVRDGEERGFTAAESKAAQADGWEKQYQYKVGRKKVYMAPSTAEAQGYERASKYPKSTKYGRQNPISARWNSDEQLVLWRKAWADVTNQFLERAESQERIDHRSHAERGLDEQPTIHEGMAARALERRGLVADRCELNRQIMADNAFLSELISLVKKLMDAVKNTIPALAEAMETLRYNIILFHYQIRHIRRNKISLVSILDALRHALSRYVSVIADIKTTARERNDLQVRKESTPMLKFYIHRDLSRRITELTKNLKELYSEKAMLLNNLSCEDDSSIDRVRKEITDKANILEKLDQQEAKYIRKLNIALNQYAEMQQKAGWLDKTKFCEARQALQGSAEQNAIRRIRKAYGQQVDEFDLRDSIQDAATVLNEKGDIQSIRGKLMQLQQQSQQTRRHQHRQEQHER